jgi:peptide deformylase
MSADKRFVPPNNSILNKIADDVDITKILSPEISDLIEQMLNVAYGEQTDRSKPVLVGLAAPQIGISKRIILVDVGADGHGGVSNLQVFINPKIIEYSKDHFEWYEGCYSTDRVCGIVSRPIKIKLSAYDKNGKKIKRE